MKRNYLFFYKTPNHVIMLFIVVYIYDFIYILWYICIFSNY